MRKMDDCEREDYRQQAREENAEYDLRLCPDCGTMKKRSGFKAGPYGQCCSSCYRGYLPE